jgi:carbon-monoxide dehydrogenase small subunit
MMQDRLTLQVDGQEVSASVEGRMHLADFLREELLKTGTHLGCEQGVCGACTVFVNGRPTRSCITLAAVCEGAQVTTVEGFDDDPLMAQIRAAFSRHHGLQCGYCTPGMLTTAYDIVRRYPHADRTQIRQELSGNLCRCTGYAGIVDAIADVLAANPPAATIQPLARARLQNNIAVHRAAESKTARAAAAVTPPDMFADLPLAADFDTAVGLQQSLSLKVAAADVWAIISDPEAIAACIPGAALDGAVEDGLVRGHCKVAVGPIKAHFGGQAIFHTDSDRQTGRLCGKGRDSLSRTELGGLLDFALVAETDDHCRLDLDMRYQLNGPLSQFGRPELVREIADHFLTAVGEAVEMRVLNPQSPADQQPSVAAGSLIMMVLKSWLRRALRLR